MARREAGEKQAGQHHVEMVNAPMTKEETHETGQVLANLEATKETGREQQHFAAWAMASRQLLDVVQAPQCHSNRTSQYHPLGLHQVLQTPHHHSEQPSHNLCQMGAPLLPFPKMYFSVSLTFHLQMSND